MKILEVEAGRLVELTETLLECQEPATGCGVTHQAGDMPWGGRP